MPSKRGAPLSKLSTHVLNSKIVFASSAAEQQSLPKGLFKKLMYFC